jgi:hypothetical protein
VTQSSLETNSSKPRGAEEFQQPFTPRIQAIRTPEQAGIDAFLSPIDRLPEDDLKVV